MKRPVQTQRSFGLTIGAAFAATAMLMRWRGSQAASSIFLVASAVLVTGAVLFPSRLSMLHLLWMRGAAALSRITTPVILSVLWFLVLTPYAVLARVLGRGGLAGWRSGWVTHRKSSGSDMRRQF